MHQKFQKKTGPCSNPNNRIVLVVLIFALLLLLLRSQLDIRQQTDPGPPVLHFPSGPLHGSLAEAFNPESGKIETWIHLNGSEYSLESLQKYHIILMYENLQTPSLCTVETLIRALCKGEIAAEISSESKDLKDVAVFVWLSNERQQEVLFDKLHELLFRRRNFRNIHLVLKKINFDEAIKDTGFHEFYQTKTEKELGRYAQQNKGNALRLALIQKYGGSNFKSDMFYLLLGGFYMDADMVVVNDPSNLDDGIAMQTGNVYNNAAFKFQSSQHPFVKRLIKNFINNYDGNRWGKQGPQLFTRVLKNTCTRENKVFHCLVKETNSTIPVHDWGTRRFYALPWYAGEKLGSDFADILRMYRLDLSSKETCIMLHVWHRTSKLVESQLCRQGWKAYKKSFIGSVKSKYCPIVTEAVFKPGGRNRRNCNSF